MEVVTVRTPGSVLAALEIRDDLSMVERRPQSIGGGLSLAVASSGSAVLLSKTASQEAEATIILKDEPDLHRLVNAGFAVGTARFRGIDMDESGLWALPTHHGVVQSGDVIRIIPREITGRSGPFPRIPDGLPDAPDNREKRFSATYEARAERLWDAIAELGYQPSLEWAGSEDGEAIVARGDDDSVLVVIDLEDPEHQQMVDRLRESEDLTAWLAGTLTDAPE